VSTNSDDYRTIEYWPTPGQRRIVALVRTSETEGMTDDELIARLEQWRQEREQPAERHLRVVE
jgi:hypothetical protein